MSFNQEQIEYMRSLDALPEAERCWCGWHPAGKCPNCTRTLAERRAWECSSCGNYPSEPHRHVTHRIGCKAVTS